MYNSDNLNMRLNEYDDRHLEKLTDRESQTLALIATGMSNKKIARQLDISDGTVKVYVRNLLRKYHLNTRLELAAWVHQKPKSDLSLKEISSPSGENQSTSDSALQLLDAIPGLVYRGYNDRDWFFEYVSAGCLPLTGYSSRHLTSREMRSYGSLILTEYEDYVWYTVQCALSKHEDYQLNYEIRCADGNVKKVWEKGKGVYSNSGRVIGIEGVILEISPLNSVD